ncbi:kinase-like domain-containing protein [Talaromyces proteolyticus]|uniref:Kinase-like domain-containing protein n=1 Tax=Talaromyces proteolyticus TaxID=1131652 RepID=A0AAD4KKN0_9EURO|nr:kinase-like domain-containing protein [Talaromyces proteolyticus]KAH8693852.1 kinase-like domain-containing protein [Talaromyces proteolyticus]
MSNFFDQPISSTQYFTNAPDARTRREATHSYFKCKVFVEPKPHLDSSETIIHQITHPASLDSIIDRQVVLQSDDRIRKSVRTHLSDLKSEKEILEIVRANTSIPVPQVYDYYKSAEFEHLILERLPGVTLEEAWPTLEAQEKTRIADEVVALLGYIRKLHSPHIKAALLHRKPPRSDIRDIAGLNQERFGEFLNNEHISTYVTARTDCLLSLPNVLSHGDLDWSNILVADKKVSGIIDWECSGYFPAYWEWVNIKRFSETLKSDGFWCQLLERRMRPSDCTQRKGIWELEQLHKALGQYTQWGLTSEARQANRARGWAEVRKIVELDSESAPPVYYAISTEHPWWLEDRHE